MPIPLCLLYLVLCSYIHSVWSQPFPLQEASLQRVLARPEVIMQEVEGYSSLSEGLREELRELLSGTQDPTLALRHSRPAPVPPQATPTSPPVSH